MPIYEYEPIDRDCLMCPNRIEVLQGIEDDTLAICPRCGLSVSRVVSRASIKVSRDVDPEKAAKKGFSTFKRIGKGAWEKVAGPDEGEKSKGEGVLNASELDDSE